MPFRCVAQADTKNCADGNTSSYKCSHYKSLVIIVSYTNAVCEDLHQASEFHRVQNKIDLCTRRIPFKKNK